MELKVNAANGSYAIEIGNKLLGAYQPDAFKRYVVITDKNVYGLYGKAFDPKRCIVLPAGEQSKNFNTLKKILDQLLVLGIDRSDAVIALGGGVVGDIAGFAAAIFKRGTKLIQIPTTLLAQVDSSVGGKTAVNLEGGKNMVGTFYQPNLVIADTDVLKTLDKRQYAAGMAEVIKYGYIADEEMYSSLKAGEYEIEKIVYYCCQIKASIVEKDPFDTGERMKLNYGHTIGHAIESAAGYGTLLHGEAVAVGMVYAAWVGECLGISPEGLTQDTKELVQKMGLPDSVDTPILKKALAYLAADKKAEDGKINFVLIDKVGHAVLEKLKIADIQKIVKELH